MSDRSDNGDLAERLRSRVHSVLDGYRGFYDEVTRTSEAGWPTWSQSIRMKAMLDNKRILVADDTGVNGKTFVAVGSKILLDRETRKRNSAFVVAPNAGMLNAWAQSEIDMYASKLRAPQQKVVTVTDYDHLDNVGDDADFVVMNWEKLSVKEDDHRWGKIKDTIERVDPLLYILDECHNAKGSSSLRAQNMRRLGSYTLDKHVMLLSATPIPNRVRDLGMIFYMLNPEKYDSPFVFSHCGPDIMKELLDRHVWFRLTRHDLKEELGLPSFREIEVPVNLTDKEAEVYFKAWSDCVLLGEGLTELRKALYDPNLCKYSAGMEGLESSKLKKVKELTDEITSRGEKVLVKTNYVEGVVPNIVKTLGEGRKVLAVTGDTALPERRRAYLEWRNSRKCGVLVTSPVTEESVDLTTGDIPCSIISLEPEMTPREFVQLSGRVYRRGQRADVTHISLVSQSAVLDQMMIGYLKTLESEYHIKIPNKFRPRTVDADMLAMRKAKNAIVDKIYGGNSISKNEESLYDANEIDRAVTHLEGLIAPSSFKSMEPFQLATIIQARWRNLGEEQFEKLVHSRGWAKWRRMYDEGWKGSASEYTLKVIGKGVDGLEEKLGYKPIILDEGSGAAYFSRATGKNVICLDIDPRFLKTGKRICDKKGIKNKYVEAKATDTGLLDDSVDIAVNAYMIFYLGQDKFRKEVEECVVEKNRIIKNGGYYVVALPYTVEDGTVKRFSENLAGYGFNEVAYYDRNKTKCNNMKNGGHIIVYQKVKECDEKLGLDLSFYDGRVRFVQ